MSYYDSSNKIRRRKVNSSNSHKNSIDSDIVTSRYKQENNKINRKKIDEDFELEKEIYYKTRVVDVSRWAFKKGILDNNLLHFNYYSYNYAYTQTYKKIYFELLRRNLSEYEAKMMSSTLSKLNPAFFSGTVVEIYRIIEVSDNYKIWSLVSDIFYHKYIDSIMKERKYDHNTLRLSLREDDESFGSVIWNKAKG